MVIAAVAWGQDAPELSAGCRIDTSAVNTAPWRQAIERVTSTRGFQRGSFSVTLLRVILEGVEPVEPTFSAGEPASVNGVPVRITGPGGASIDLESSGGREGQHPDEDRYAAPIQAVSIKLNTLDSFPQGGGRFANLESGDFLLVEHINSSSRRGGKDPVRVVTPTHGRVDLRVPATDRGELGVYGDVILPKIPRAKLGRILADIRSPPGKRPRAQRMEVGLVTVGGPYGDHYATTADHVATSRLLAPGEYPILLPTPETPGTPTNRWKIDVEPGSVTYLTFFDPGEGEIELRNTQTIRPGDPAREETLKQLLK